jgi:hydroxymethylglutaryl-CoA lyase
VPQLGDASEVFAAIRRRPGTVYSALVPNERGMDAALAARAQKVSVFAAASEGFSKANTGGSIEDVLARFAPVVRAARAASIPVRGYVSCVVRCPYDGATPPERVREVSDRLLALGVDEIDLGETLGVAEPADIERLYDGLARSLAPARTTLHLHDTNGLGGCPYAPGARGNVDTAALVRMLHDSGYDTGVDLDAVSRATSAIRQALRPAAS